MLQLRMPEPGERSRRAQVSEANRVPNNEAGLVRSALPARGTKVGVTFGSSRQRGGWCTVFGVRTHSLSAADIRAAGRVVIGEMTGKVGAKPS